MLSVYKTFTLRYNKVICVLQTCTHYIKSDSKKGLKTYEPVIIWK